MTFAMKTAHYLTDLTFEIPSRKHDSIPPAAALFGAYYSEVH